MNKIATYQNKEFISCREDACPQTSEETKLNRFQRCCWKKRWTHSWKKQIPCRLIKWGHDEIDVRHDAFFHKLVTPKKKIQKSEPKPKIATGSNVSRLSPFNDKKSRYRPVLFVFRFLSARKGQPTDLLLVAMKTSI